MRACPADVVTILPDFFETYTMLLCDGSTSCLASGTLVPDARGQLEVLEALRGIQGALDISGFDPLVFKLLLDHDEDRLQKVLMSIAQLRDAQHVLEEIRDATM
jgi:hypothetical protein